MPERLLPISPRTCTINGSVWRRACDMIWIGLHWDTAEVQETSVLMRFIAAASGWPMVPRDYHLNVGWTHPLDSLTQIDGVTVRYRLRPRHRYRGWRFLLIGDRWHLSSAAMRDATATTKRC